jgi:hypothetical protein
MNLRPSLRILLAATCGIGSLPAASAAESLTCPAVFPMTALHFDTADSGWTAEPGEHPPALVGWGLYSGPPSRLAALMPSGEGKGLLHWKLEGPEPLGLWVQCSYADWALTLTRRLSITEGECVAPSKKPRSGKAQPVTFVCK